MEQGQVCRRTRSMTKRRDRPQAVGAIPAAGGGSNFVRIGFSSDEEAGSH